MLCYRNDQRIKAIGMETFENASINLENYEEYVEMNLTA